MFVAEKGFVYQDKGDAECMRYEPLERMGNLVNSASILTSYTLATITDEQSEFCQAGCRGRAASESL